MEGLGVGWEVEFGFRMVTVCVCVCVCVCMCVCVRVVYVKDRVGSGDCLLRSRFTCGGSVCGGVGVSEGVRVC